MNSDLASFSNAFTAPIDLPVVHLLGTCSTPISTYGARRQIERWQTKALAARLFDAYGVTNGYQLEKMLLVSEPRLVFPDDRPRLFHRMFSRGEPGIAKELAKPDSLAAVWVGKALSRAPNALEVLADQIWRLLDPSPMRHVEWAHTCDALMPRTIEQLSMGSTPEAWQVRMPLDPESGGELVDYFVPKAAPATLWGLLLVLVQLRRWELNGNLIAYYLQLLEAMERCLQPMTSSDLAVLMPECANYLVACFGRVHIGPVNQENVEFQVCRLNAAWEAFAEIRGGLRSSRPMIVKA